jgi:hypothetical protein
MRRKCRAFIVLSAFFAAGAGSGLHLDGMIDQLSVSRIREAEFIPASPQASRSYRDASRFET